MARRFFYVSLGILALALAYNLGAHRADAQGERIGCGGSRGSPGFIGGREILGSQFQDQTADEQLARGELELDVDVPQGQGGQVRGPLRPARGGVAARRAPARVQAHPCTLEHDAPKAVEAGSVVQPAIVAAAS